MTANTHLARPEVKGLVLIAASIFGAMVLCVGSLANDDPLWFLPLFNEAPTRIRVNRVDCQLEVTDAHPEFESLLQAINAAISQIDGYDPFGLSPATLQAYREQERSVELFFPKRVTIHTNYRFGHPDTILIPLSGPFAETRSLFGGYAGDYWAGALRLKSISGIQRAVEPIPCTR